MRTYIALLSLLLTTNINIKIHAASHLHDTCDDLRLSPSSARIVKHFQKKHTREDQQKSKRRSRDAEKRASRIRSYHTRKKQKPSYFSKKAPR